MERIKNYIQRKTTLQDCKNFVEARNRIKIILIAFGAGVLLVKQGRDGRVTNKFNISGLLCYVLWSLMYFYCTYKIYNEDQSIVRNHYDTELKHYGDDIERIACSGFFIYCAWKFAFNICGDTYLHQCLVDIDKVIFDMGVSIDYNEYASLIWFLGVIEATVIISRTTIICFTMPYFLFALVFLVNIIDTIALTLMTFYYFFLRQTRDRYKIINNQLAGLTPYGSREHALFVRVRPPQNGATSQRDEYVCERIKACARLYGMLYNATDYINQLYGFALGLLLLFCLLNVVLNLFYLMEATAAGLYRDPLLYMYLLLYLFWRVANSLVIAYLIVFTSESVAEEAAKTACVTHQIMRCHLSPSVMAEADKLSVQLLHQKVKFTADEFFKLDFELLLGGARSVVTFLVMLLQYVTDN